MIKKENLQVIVMQYVKSILEMVDSISSKNINQVVSLIKANVRVLEDDVRKSFTKEDYNQDFNYRDYN
tara:strand:+ start:991 stop:1194 length:204 start_codon:yes stop_codon:yes gene_type:complete